MLGHRLNSSLLLLLTTLLTLTHAAHLTFSVTPSPLLPNPANLPPSTRATLFRLNNTLVAPYTRYNTFDFKTVTPGSYLLTVQCRDFVFAPLRVDVVAAAAATAAVPETGAGVGEEKEKVEVHQTFWGNEWGNKGERRGGGVWRKNGKGERIVVEVRPERVKDFYQERAGFSVLPFLKSPMILMALFSLVVIVGLPYLTDSMDEETRKEFEELQAKGPLSSGMNSDAAKSFQNFDLAGWMAGKSTGSSGTATPSGAEGGASSRR